MFSSMAFRMNKQNYKNKSVLLGYEAMPSIIRRLSWDNYKGEESNMRMTLIFFIAFLGYGCGAKKMAVENADTLINYQITKRLPLYSAQKDQLNRDVDIFLNKEKPVAQEIIPIIDEINLKNPDQVESQYKKLEAFFMRLSKDFTATMAKYLAKLDSKQQKDLFATLDDENREILKKEKEDRIDGVEDKFKTFMGSMNSKQKQIIREYSDYFHERAKHRLTRRVRLHDTFRSIYQHDLSEAAKADEFADAFNQYQVDAISGNKNLEIVKRILPTVTPDQREHFRKEVQEIKDLIRYYNSIEY
jgi:hypothetical protein